MNPTFQDRLLALSSLQKQAAREYDGDTDNFQWIAVQHRLQAAYQKFTLPCRDDQFAEGVIIGGRIAPVARRGDLTPRSSRSRNGQ